MAGNGGADKQFDRLKERQAPPRPAEGGCGFFGKRSPPSLALCLLFLWLCNQASRPDELRPFLGGGKGHSFRVDSA